jgi:hypothetical protein
LVARTGLRAPAGHGGRYEATSAGAASAEFRFGPDHHFSDAGAIMEGMPRLDVVGVIVSDLGTAIDSAPLS